MGASKSIADSRKRESFLFTYDIFLPKHASLDPLGIKEIFIEQCWYIGLYKSTYNSNFLNLVIAENEGNNFFEKYAIGNLTYTDDNILVWRFDTSKLTDTLRLPISHRESGEKLGFDVYFVKLVDTF